MKIINRILIGALGMLIPALLTPNCYGQCGGGRLAHTSMSVGLGSARLLPAAFVPDQDSNWDRNTPPSIVGFWHQQLISEGNSGIPDGTVLDDDLAQWHSDNTEIQNTKSRTPMAGDFCLGVWEQTGPNTFRLNHFPQAFDATGTMYLGTWQLQEEITVARDGKTYRGTFTLDQYDPDGNLPTNGHVQGKVKGTRITTKSTIMDLL